MPAHLCKTTVGGHSAFSDGLESLADDLAGVDNGQKGLRVLPAQEIPQQPCLPPGQRHHDHGAGLAGVHAGGVLLGRRASQCFRNEMPDGLRPCCNNRTHLAEIQALDGCIQGIWLLF